jgi:uncharacterized lipoprotein
MRQAIALVAGVSLAAALAACGERPQVVQYKQGTYQGKPDQKAYDTAPWNGNKRDWELALANRNQSQNEYKRIR